MNGVGQIGITALTQVFTSPLEGQFGLSIQLGTNVLIQIFDQFNRPVRGVVLTIAYTNGATTYFESINYDFNRPVNRTLAEDVPITLMVHGPGYAPISGTFTVALGTQETFILFIRKVATNLIIRRNRVR